MIHDLRQKSPVNGHGRITGVGRTRRGVLQNELGLFLMRSSPPLKPRRLYSPIYGAAEPHRPAQLYPERFDRIVNRHSLYAVGTARRMQPFDLPIC